MKSLYYIVPSLILGSLLYFAFFEKNNSLTVPFCPSSLIFDDLKPVQSNQIQAKEIADRALQNALDFNRMGSNKDYCALSIDKMDHCIQYLMNPPVPGGDVIICVSDKNGIFYSVDFGS